MIITVSNNDPGLGPVWETISIKSTVGTIDKITVWLVDESDMSMLNFLNFITRLLVITRECSCS